MKELSSSSSQQSN